VVEIASGTRDALLRMGGADTGPLLSATPSAPAVESHADDLLNRVRASSWQRERLFAECSARPTTLSTTRGGGVDLTSFRP
jgi:hypothetical protein